jgi:cold shock CspA family protein
MAINKPNKREIGSGQFSTTGYILFYRRHLGYGFIRSHVGIDYFFHFDDVMWNDTPVGYPKRGQFATFTARPLNDAGPRAATVNLTNSIQLKQLEALDRVNQAMT